MGNKKLGVSLIVLGLVCFLFGYIFLSKSLGYPVMLISLALIIVSIVQLIRAYHKSGASGNIIKAIFSKLESSFSFLFIGGILCLIFIVTIAANMYVSADNTRGIHSFRDKESYCEYGDCTNEATKKLVTYQFSSGLMAFLGDSDYYQIANTSGSYTTTDTNVTFDTKKVLIYDDILGGFVVEKVKVPSGVTTETTRHNVTSYVIGGNYCAEHLSTAEAKIKGDVIIASFFSFWYFLIFIVLYIIVLVSIVVRKRNAKLTIASDVLVKSTEDGKV